LAYLVLESSVRTHRKFLAAGPAACWLWVCGLGYCQEGLTDGFIPRTAIDFLGVKGAARLADKLVLVALWDIVAGGWQVHDYLEHNRSSDQVRELMRRRAEGGKLGGRPAKTSKVSEVETLKVIEVPETTETFPETLSGSSVLPSSPSVLPTEKGARANEPRWVTPTQGQPKPLIDGRLQRTHAGHVYCPPGRANLCVTPYIHEQTRDALGGDEAAQALYRVAIEALGDRPCTDDALPFWKNVRQRAVAPVSSPPAAATGKGEQSRQNMQRAVARVGQS
jgi:hypothetical protein